MGLFKKKPAVDSAEIILLRTEIGEMKERLEASEQGKVVLEDRLSSIAATTMILSNTAQSNTAEIVEQIESIHSRLDSADEIGSKVDELHQRVIEAESRQPLTDELPPPSDVTAKLAALSGRIEQVAQLAAAPAQPDDELAARLEQLTSSAATVEALNMQFGTLSSRVNAQAEMADQLRALSERISLLQQRSVDTSEITERIEQLSMAAPMTDELGERVVDLAARVASSEAQAAEAKAKAIELEARLAQADSDGTDDADVVRTELVALTDRVAAHDHLTEQLTALETRLAANEAELTAAREQAAALEQRLAETPGRELEQQLESQLTQRLDERLGERLVELAGRLDAQDERTAQLVATAPVSDELSSRLDELATRLAASEAELRGATDRAAALEQRLSTETPNGVDERLAAIDSRLGELNERDLDLGRIHELLDQLRSNTPSNDLVNEQLAELGRRVAESELAAQAANDRANSLDERFGQVDGRVGDIGNQLGELGGRLGDVDGRVGQVAERSNQLDQLNERLANTEEAARQAREAAATLEQRLADDDRGQRLDQQLAELQSQLARHGELPDQLAALNGRISQLQDRGVDVDRIHERLDQLSTSMPSTDGLQDELNRLAQRVANSEGDARSARELAAALEDRMGNISTELANQLGELSLDLDQLAAREPVEVPVAQVDEQAVLSLKASQVKLASEQARYEITFREDLAQLAEQVRQLRGRS